MLSSLSGVFGWASQSNYAAGGSYQDTLARFRVAQGLLVMSLDLGMVTIVGYMSETSSVSDRLNKAGLSLPLSDEDVMQALGTAILHPLDQPQVLLGLNSGPGPHWDATRNSAMGRDARFMPLRCRRPTAGAQGQAAQTQDASGANAKPLSAKLQEAGSLNEAEQLVGDAIATKLADIFMIPVGDIDMTQPPASLGVDSLVAVELRNMLMLKAAADVPVFNILQSVSLAALAVDVVAKSNHVTVRENAEVGGQQSRL